jgi:hypothetical protein
MAIRGAGADVDDTTTGGQSAAVPPARAHRKLLIAGAAALVIVLVAALVTWRVWPKGPGRAPFDRAVAAFAAAEAVTYRTSLAGFTSETRVTRHGDSIGTLALLGRTFGMLSIGGKSYVKTPPGLLPGGGSASLGLRNRWVLGGGGLAGATAQASAPPATLAKRMAELVDRADRFATATVDGVGAYVAHAPSGDLYVTRDKPNTVLRLTARGGPALPSLPAIPQLPGVPSGSSPPSGTAPRAPSGVPSLPPLPTVPSLPPIPDLPDLPDLPKLPAYLAGFWLRAPTPPGGAAQAQPPPQLDLAPMTAPQTDELYEDLASSGTELVSATDPSVQFTAQASGTIGCGGGCTVNASVTDQVTGTGQTTVTGSEVTAEMTAVISVDGSPAGTCVSPPTPIPANGTGQVSCVDPTSGAVAQARLAQKRAAAAGKGGLVSVTVTAQVQISATAMTKAQVKQEVDRLKKQGQEARNGRAPPAYPAEGVHVGPVNLGTRQAGTANPVHVDGLSDPWRVTVERLLIEDALGGNLPEGSRAVDVYTAHDGGTAISIKTIDPRKDTYRVSPSSIGSEGYKMVDTLLHYRRGTDLWNPLIPPDAVSVWVLRLAYPAGTATPKVLEQLAKIADYGAKNSVIVQLVPIEG